MARAQIVENADPIAALDEGFGDMGTNENRHRR